MRFEIYRAGGIPRANRAMKTTKICPGTTSLLHRPSISEEIIPGLREKNFEPIIDCQILE
jgi:hypothetical protein